MNKIEPNQRQEINAKMCRKLKVLDSCEQDILKKE